MEKDLSAIQKTIGHKFKNLDLLRQAMVHRSYLNENPGFPLGHNERLEYLGDAVLELVVTDYLYHTFPHANEGDMTNWRASLVNSKMLAEIASTIDIDSSLYLSRGESRDKGSKARQYILTNAFEALIGALYLDKGYKAGEKFIHTFVIPRLPTVFEKGLDVDPKSKFQEIAQEKLRVTPHYEVIEEKGPDHARWFKVGVFLGKECVGMGEGTSKQEAQVSAAEKALEVKGWA
ncbi:ribonuclease III [Candidatus Uhrbacteria bacterium]|nr:ribonuclease III [Candidatus Uhrbacteria bacterium]